MIDLLEFNDVAQKARRHYPKPAGWWRRLLRLGPVRRCPACAMRWPCPAYTSAAQRRSRIVAARLEQAKAEGW